MKLIEKLWNFVFKSDTWCRRHETSFGDTRIAAEPKCKSRLCSACCRGHCGCGAGA